MRGSSVGARSAPCPLSSIVAPSLIRVCAVWATLWELADLSRKVDRHRPEACGVPSRCKTPILIRRTIESFVLYSYFDLPF